MTTSSFSSDRSSHIPKITFRKGFERVPYLDVVNASYLTQLDKLVFDKDVILSGEYEGSPELLSYQLYSTVDYWWIICLVNEVIDPVEDFIAGKRLVIPSLQSIENFLTSSINIGAGNSYIGEVIEID